MLGTAFGGEKKVSLRRTVASVRFVSASVFAGRRATAIPLPDYFFGKSVQFRCGRYRVLFETPEIMSRENRERKIDLS